MDSEFIRDRQQIMDQFWFAEDRSGGADSPEVRQAAAKAVSQLEELLARSEDDFDDRERGLTLRYLGDAYFSLSGKNDQESLAKGRRAYMRAELLTRSAGDRLDMAKLNFNMANTLRAIGEAPDFPFLAEARRRYNDALKVFSAGMPEAVPQVQSALQSLEIIAEGVRMYDAAKRSHDRIADLYKRLEQAGPAIESRVLNEVVREFEHLKGTEKKPAALLAGFQDFLASAGTLLAQTEQDEDNLEEANSTLENLAREFSAGLGIDATDEVFDRVFELLDGAGDSGEVSEERRDALHATLMEFRALTRESPETPEAMVSQVARMREVINRYKPVLLSSG